MTSRYRLSIVLCLAMAAILQMAAGQTASDPPAWKRALVAARDRQDVAALQSLASDASPDFRRALAHSYLAEVYLELGKKDHAAATARQGIQFARKAVEMDANDARNHYLLGALCGQVIPASPLSALSFGQCAREEVETALRLDPRLPEAHLARGVGNYYLPTAFGGGLEKAEADFRNALQFAPGWPDAHLWLGLVSRRRGNLASAREHLLRARHLAPSREWIRIQLDKTPAPSPK